jgi:hypothetical protein
MTEIDTESTEKGSPSLGGHRAWLRGAAVLGALVACAAVGLAACGGGGSSTSAATAGNRSASFDKLVAYARCMRSHGVTNYPDPQTSSGGISISVPDPNSPQVQSAERACRSLAPPAPTAAQQAQNLARELSYSRCMRSHGVPNFPDPPPNRDLNIGGTGIDKRSPQFQQAMQHCQSILGSGAQPQQLP